MDARDFQHDDPERATPRREAERAKRERPAIGNAAFQRIMPSLQGTGPSVLDESISRAIHAKRGHGNPLDAGAQQDLGATLGDDFSDVNVHTDGEADRLNRAVRAEAFTTGTDVFFREGKYDPGSNEGRKLLAHELTHVVQQREAPPKQELTLSDPGDSSERQASTVADSVASSHAEPSAPVARHADHDEGEEGAAREAAPEEEEEAAASPVAREAAPEEEEEAATSPVAREAAPEEEEEAATSPVAREAAPEEEEEMATSRVERQEAPAEEEEEEAAPA
jgi:hypothetical protein